MSGDWTRPSHARLAAEHRLDEATAHDLAQAEILRAAHTAFLQVARGLEFVLDYPKRGYTLEDLVGTLEDMAPMPAADYAALLDGEASALLRETDDNERLDAIQHLSNLRAPSTMPAVVTAKSRSKAPASKGKRKVPTPADLRRQPEFKLPIEGGKRSAQHLADLEVEPNASEERTVRSRREA